jgi:hypothetical protein
VEVYGCDIGDPTVWKVASQMAVRLSALRAGRALALRKIFR